MCAERGDGACSIFLIKKQREIIALDRQGTQQQRPESSTVTPPGVRVNTRYINSTKGTPLTFELSPKVFKCFFGIWNFKQSFCWRTEGAQWLVIDERRDQIWRKSVTKVTDSECCELVTNAVLYRETVGLFQKR